MEGPRRKGWQKAPAAPADAVTTDRATQSRSLLTNVGWSDTDMIVFILPRGICMAVTDRSGS